MVLTSYFFGNPCDSLTWTNDDPTSGGAVDTIPMPCGYGFVTALIGKL
jgi:hypothetical protein